MSVPFKYLSHEILNKPKSAPAIRVYPAAPRVFHPQANREASDASQAGDHYPCPPLITEPTPTSQKKKKNPRKPSATSRDPQINPQPPQPISRRSPSATSCRQISHCRQHHLRPWPLPLGTSSHRRCKPRDRQLPLRRCNLPRLTPPPSSTTSTAVHRRANHVVSFSFCVFFFFFLL